METRTPPGSDATAREVAELREDLEAVTVHVRLLVEQQEGSLRREDALRAAVVAAREDAACREDELRREAAGREQRWAEDRAALRAELAAAADRERRLRDELAASREQLTRHAHETDLLRADRDALRARLDRLRRSLPGRVYARVRSLGGRVLRLTAGAGRAA